MKRWAVGLGCLVVLGHASAAAQSATERHPIIPIPRSIEARRGEFRINADTRIVLSHPANAQLRAVAELFASPLRAVSGLPLPVAAQAARRARARNTIELRLTPTVSGSPEHYQLSVTDTSVTLGATSIHGLFNGLQTLRQLLPATYERGVRLVSSYAEAAVRPTTAKRGEEWTVAAVEIDDEPRFRYRGVLLDVGRFYYPVEAIKRQLDLLALYRMNVFQLHLTDYQGWRVEILKYPKLTQIGAWRRETVVGFNVDPYISDRLPHGGFYTQEEVRDLVAYAAARNITIIPEIEMPGHAGAALAAYPDLSCRGGPFEVRTVWGVHQEVFCPSERTFAFLEDVLTEIMQLFPSEYIHIGGDEVLKDVWHVTPVAQEVMRRERLANEHELQSYFIRRIERFLNAHGRKLIGWDEILEGGLAPRATVMSWRGMQGGIQAAREGHDVIMSPTTHAYFDHYQGEPVFEPFAIGGFIPLEKVYSFEPVPRELTGELSRHVIGGQANLWTEYIRTQQHAEFMLLPRLAAMAEVLWSPGAARNWEDFLRRLAMHLPRYDALGVNYRVPDVIGMTGHQLVLDEGISIELRSPVPGAEIRYTVDSSEPTRLSAAYKGPFVLTTSDSVTLRARLFLPNGRESQIRQARYTRATFLNPVSVPAGRLRNGLRYAYKEGTFSLADSVRAAPTTRTGIIPAVSLPGNERDVNFGLRINGFIRVPRDGIYTFHLTSDDGSKLLIGDRIVIDLDGYHAPEERSHQVALRAGLHPIEVVFFQAEGERVLQLEVTAPGGTRQAMPADWLLHDD